MPNDVAENPANLTVPSQISFALISKVASPFDAETALLCLVWFPAQQILMSMRAPCTGAPLQSFTSTTVEPGEQSARSPSALMPVTIKSATLKNKRIGPPLSYGAVL
ncbi:MAG TPA: hypothetical protein VMQ56_10425 [Terracidiphilus sp.]|nr:hypothetical protein [Terracidiphilus sp.]